MPLSLVALLIVGCSSGPSGSTQSSASSTNATDPSTSPTSDGPTSEGPTTDATTTPTSMTPTTESTSIESESESEPSSPVIESLVVDPPSLTAGQSVTFTAVVSDPDGDISGGVLFDLAANKTYGTFAEIDDNTYAVTLTWDEINAVDPITFNDDSDRAFRAQFTDETDLTAMMMAFLTLTCNGQASCEGTCTELGTEDDNCGACPVVCQGDAFCKQGSCVTGEYGDCFDPMGMNCAEYCGESSQICVSNGCDGWTYRGYSSFSDCEANQNSFIAEGDCDSEANCAFICDPPIAVRCCCG